MARRLPTNGPIRSLPSATLNGVIEDYARRTGQPLAEAQVQQVRRAISSIPITPYLACEVLNDTGSDLVEYGVAGIEEPAYTPPAISGDNTADETTLQPPVVVLEDATAAHGAKFVITLEPIADGARGLAVVMGLTWARVDIQDSGDTAAAVQADAEKLLGGDSGATIIWKPAGTGEAWCLVLIGGGTVTVGGGGGGDGHTHYECIIVSDIEGAVWNDGATPPNKDPGHGWGYLLSQTVTSTAPVDRYTLLDSGKSIELVDEVSGSGNVNTLDLAWPSELERGNLALLFTYGYDAADGDRAQTPSGFTQAESVRGTNGRYCELYTKELTGDETGNLTVGFDATAKQGATLLIYRNVRYYDSTATAVNTQTGPSVTTDLDDGVLVTGAVAIEDGSTGTGFSSYGGTVEIVAETYDIGSGAPNSSDFIATAKDRPTAGSGGVGTYTSIDEASGNCDAIIAVALDVEKRVELWNGSADPVTVSDGYGLFGRCMLINGRHELEARDCATHEFEFTEPE